MAVLWLVWGSGQAAAGLAVGDEVEVMLKGVPAGEQEQVNGKYMVREGGVRLPMLGTLVPARGLTADQLARVAEAAYQKEGIYANPAIEVRVVRGADVPGDLAKVSVGGHVNRPGFIDYRKGMTLAQAVQAAGDRTAFGGAAIVLVRGARSMKLDYRKQEDRNLTVLPNDTITVQQRGPFEGNRG
jgi:protein involved in polysaccharide export with SLBB domain